MSSKQQRTSVVENLPEIVNPPKSLFDNQASIPARILLALFLCAGGIATIIGCVDVIQTYRAKPITTEYHIIPNNIMDLPSVHVCVQDDLMSTYRKKLQSNLSSNLSAIFKHHFDMGHFEPSMITSSIISEALKMEFNALMQKVGAKNVLDLLRQWAVKCEDIIMTCGFLSAKDCCRTASWYRTYIGTCFSFPPSKQIQPGMSQGFTIVTTITNAIVFVCPNQEFCGLCTGSKSHCTFRRVNVKPPWTLIVLHSRFFDGLRESSETCKDVQVDEKYNDHICSWECLLHTFGQMCGCNHLHFPMIYGSLDDSLEINCSFWDMLKCNVNMNSQKVMDDPVIREIEKNCSKTCPAPCTRSEYTFDIITDPFYAAQLEGGMIIDVFYGSMEYVYIKQRLSMTFLRALTNLGGHLSLYLGVSVFSILSKVVFIISFCVQQYVVRCSSKHGLPAISNHDHEPVEENEEFEIISD